MKTKLTLIILEVPPYNRAAFPKARLVVNKNNQFPNKYVSTKNIDETLIDLCSSCIYINYAWLNPQLTDLVHEEKGTVEAIYVTVLETGTLVCKPNYKIMSLDDLKIKEIYAKSITSTPRTIGQ